MKNQYAVFSSYGKQMSEPFDSLEDANKYAEQLRIDFADDSAYFFVEAI